MNMNKASLKIVITAMLVLATSSASAQNDCTDCFAGDCNGDGNVNIIDALIVGQHTASILTLSGLRFDCCNVIGVRTGSQAVVNVLDALLIAQYSAGLIDRLSSIAERLHLILTHSGDESYAVWDMAPLVSDPPYSDPMLINDPDVRDLPSGTGGSARAEVISDGGPSRVLLAPADVENYAGLFEVDACESSPSTPSPATLYDLYGNPIASPYIYDIAHDHFFFSLFCFVYHEGLDNPTPPELPKPVCVGTGHGECRSQKYWHDDETLGYGPPAGTPSPGNFYMGNRQTGTGSENPALYHALEYTYPTWVEFYAYDPRVTGEVWDAAREVEEVGTIDSLQMHPAGEGGPGWFDPEGIVYAIAFDNVPASQAYGRGLTDFRLGTAYLALNLSTNAPGIASIDKRRSGDAAVNTRDFILEHAPTKFARPYAIALDFTPQSNQPYGTGYVSWVEVQNSNDVAYGHISSFELDPDPDGSEFDVIETIEHPSSGWYINGLAILRPKPGTVLLYAYTSPFVSASGGVVIDVLDVSMGFNGMTYGQLCLENIPVPVSANSIAREITPGWK